MPFRQIKSVRELLDQYRRGGESSFSALYYGLHSLREQGHSRADGSFTERLRNALFDWLDHNYGTRFATVIFDYRLSRKRTVTVTARGLYLRHDPLCGKGSRGFVLDAEILSIDGTPYKGPRGMFSWNRIIGREKLLLITEGGRDVR